MRYIRTTNNYVEFVETDASEKIISTRGFKFGVLYFQVKNDKVTFFLNDQENPWRNDIWSINIPFSIDDIVCSTEEEAVAELQKIMQIDKTVIATVEWEDYYTKEESDERYELKGSGSTIVDDELDINSKNAVANSAITIAINSKLDASAYTPTDLSDYYKKSETSGATEISSALSEKQDKSGMTNYSTTVEMNAAINAATRGKADIDDIPSVDGYFDGASYDSQTKRINFKHNNEILAYIDATDFIKDGMVSSVEIRNGKLVITFNSDAGKEAIELNISDIFNADNYYTKDEVNAELAKKADTAVTYTKTEVNGLLDNKLNTSAFNTYSADTKTVIDGKLDASAYTPTDLSNYYKKSETSGATEISNALSEKQNTLIAGDNITISGNVISATGGGGVQVQSDWNENNSGSTAYIKNRTHYTYEDYAVERTLSGNTSVEIDSTHYGLKSKWVGVGFLESGKQYRVTIGEDEYVVTATTLANGNVALNVEEGAETPLNDTWSIYKDTSDASYQATVAINDSSLAGQPISVKVEKWDEIVVPLENKYLGLPISGNTDNRNIIANYFNNSISNDCYGCFAEGTSNTISGNSDYSHAEGQYNTISGSNSSHAEGESNTISSSSYRSHTEGSSNKIISSSYNSHAEGYSNTISGFSYYSHAEGANNKIISGSSYSHAEGQGNTISGNSNNSHAEGSYNTISGDSYNSHAEGANNKIISGSSYSHAEGEYNTISGSQYSHAEGIRTTVSGDFSHAEGNYTKASGDSSHAEGAGTEANNYASHAEGVGAKANGYASHAEGGRTIASGYHSHAEGGGTFANGDYSHAEGDITVANNYSEHASGKHNNSVSASTIFGNSGNTLFSVGNGASNSTRHNAFEIRQDGSIYIPNLSGGTDYYDRPMIKLQDALSRGGGGGDTSVIELTQAQYNALATKDPNVIYVITDATSLDGADYYTKADVYTKSEIDAMIGNIETLLSQI